MIENIITVLMVCLLGVTYGWNLAYLREQTTGATMPFVLNGIMTLFIFYGIFGATKTLEPGQRIFLFVVFTGFFLYEWHILANKPATVFDTNVAYLMMTSGAMMKLYWIISLHCGYSTTLARDLKGIIPKFEIPKVKAEEPVKPRTRDEPRTREDIDVNQIWNKAVNVLTESLRSSEKTDEEKHEALNKLRVAFGKEPKEFRER